MVKYRDSWLSSTRTFVLKEATRRFPKVADPGRCLVIQEPNGSLGAPLLMEALLESRMILLVRDPRDVTASSMDARPTEGWRYESRRKTLRTDVGLIGRIPRCRCSRSAWPSR